MNRYSITLLVGVAALCTGLSSGSFGKDSIAAISAHVSTGWHDGIAFFGRNHIAQP